MDAATGLELILVTLQRQEARDPRGFARFLLGIVRKARREGGRGRLFWDGFVQHGGLSVTLPPSERVIQLPGSRATQ